jgi:aminopeptidase N
MLAVACAVAVLLPNAPRSNAQDNTLRGSELCAVKHQRAAVPASRSAGRARVQQSSIDVLDYRLRLDLYACFVSPYPRSFTAGETVTFRVTSPTSSIQLDADGASLQIDSVGMAGAAFTHVNDLLTVQLDRSYAAGEVASVDIAYRHRNVVDNAFYVSAGSVFTDCEPEGARKWFPCWDKPSDKATVDITARVPASVRLGSNGRLADSVRTGDTLTYRWVSRDPVATYLAVLSAKAGYRLDIVHWLPPSNPSVPTPIRFYWNAGEEAGVAAIKAKILPMTDLFSALFGEHPFEKNGFATLTPEFPWGGMENQTLTSLCPNCWRESLIAHEFAHQWFGDMITCETWADIWLNEGFATFCESLWLEETSGSAAYKSDVLANATYYLNNNPGRPIYDPSWAVTTPPSSLLFNYAVTYAKSACVLHMLRATLGDSLFFHAMRSYATDTLYFKYRTADTETFVGRVNEYTGQNLWWFFNAWLAQPNHPVYDNTYSISDLGGGQWEVGLRARQTQTDGTFFPMPLTFRISFASGGDTLVRVMNDVSPQSYGVRFARRPTTVSFDPNNDIVLKRATWGWGPTAARVILLSPADGEAFEGALPVLTWIAAAAAVTYDIQVAADSLFGPIVADSTGLAATDFTPPGPLPAGQYFWRVRGVNAGGAGEWSDARTFDVRAPASAGGTATLPSTVELDQNFPNPFNPETVIRFSLPSKSAVRLVVYDVLGRIVAVLVDGTKEAGRHEVRWNAGDVPSGIYLCRLEGEAQAPLRKLVLVK